MFWDVKQAVGLHCIYNDAEEVGNWGNQIESKQPFFGSMDTSNI